MPISSSSRGACCSLPTMPAVLRLTSTLSPDPLPTTKQQSCRAWPCNASLLSPPLSRRLVSWSRTAASAGPGRPGQQRSLAWAGSSGTRDIDIAPDRAVDAQGSSDPQQLGGASVAAPQVAVQRTEGHWLAEPVAQAHEICDRARRVIDPDRLARSRLHARQSQLKGPVLEAKHRSRREGDLRGRLDPGTATWTVAGISSVRSWTAAADSRHTMARGTLRATASKSGKLAAGASA